jgi:hypothetical protein
LVFQAAASVGERVGEALNGLADQLVGP